MVSRPSAYQALRNFWSTHLHDGSRLHTFGPEPTRDQRSCVGLSVALNKIAALQVFQAYSSACKGMSRRSDQYHLIRNFSKSSYARRQRLASHKGEIDLAATQDFQSAPAIAWLQRQVDVRVSVSVRAEQARQNCVCG